MRRGGFTNEPHEEDDYVSFDLCNREFVFVIQYYDMKLEYHSIDPADPSITRRIGTLC